MSKQSKRLTETVPPEQLSKGKRKRGRPATGNDPMMGFRMPVELKAEIDAWAAAQDDKPPRSEAMRRLMKIGLASAPAPRRSAKRGVTGL